MNQNPYAAPEAPITGHNPTAPPMTILRVLFSFSGRINRAKYWAGTVFVWVVFVAAIMIFSLFAEPTTSEYAFEETSPEWLAEGDESYDVVIEDEPESDIFFVALIVLAIPFVWVYLAVEVKRWHDRGKSGWMVLIAIIPFGGLWIFVECGCLAGTAGPNQHGPDPLMR